jgi:hypothetical protein
MMCPVIDNPASCKICAIISFPHTKYVRAAEIHHKLCRVYSWNVMSEGTYDNCVEQCFSTARPWPGTEPWHQLYQAVL